MHTYAQTPALAQLTGTLLHAAEARTKVLDGEGQTVPVLCMDVEIDTVLRTHVHLQQFFPAGQHTQAHAAARRFPRGKRIAFSVELVSVELNAIATHIHIEHQEATPCQQ